MAESESQQDSAVPTMLGECMGDGGKPVDLRPGEILAHELPDGRRASIRWAGVHDVRIDAFPQCPTCGHRLTVSAHTGGILQAD
jgi:hypothetical protein